MEWTPEKLALAEKWLAAQERLYREVYRLGPVRHILNPRFQAPPWRDSYQKVKSAVSAKPLEKLPPGV